MSENNTVNSTQPPPQQVECPGDFSAEHQPIQTWADLSSDAASPEADVRVQLLQQRLSHQKWLFFAALFFVATLTLFFLYFVIQVLCLAHNSTNLDASILWLGSGLIVPSSAVMFILMRNIYAPLNEKTESSEAKSGGDIAPIQVCLTELASTFRELIKAVPSILKR